MSSRRKARAAVLRALFLSESKGITVDEAFAEMAACDAEMTRRAGEPDAALMKPFSLGIEGENLAFARSLGRTVAGSREAFNARIRTALHNWDLDRVARIDHIILWIALAEYDTMPDIPRPVIINEAIELARTYSSHKSPAFINGVLDAVLSAPERLSGQST
jgi:transcription antitermination factor NusB